MLNKRLVEDLFELTCAEENLRCKLDNLGEHIWDLKAQILQRFPYVSTPKIVEIGDLVVYIGYNEVTVMTKDEYEKFNA